MSDSSTINITAGRFHVQKNILRSIFCRKRKKPACKVEAAKSMTPPVAVRGLAAALEQEEIAHRAWEIWHQEGCPEGRAEMHWRRAEDELQEEQLHQSS